MAYYHRKYRSKYSSDYYRGYNPGMSKRREAELEGIHDDRRDDKPFALTDMIVKPRRFK